MGKQSDAAKAVTGHAVLLPDGFRFSAGDTRRDWTDDMLARTREFYGRFTASLDAAALAASVAGWQSALWKFNHAGQIGRQFGRPDGPASWMEAVTPLVDRQEFRVKLAGHGDGTATPEPSIDAPILSGLACGGYAVFSRTIAHSMPSTSCIE